MIHDLNGTKIRTNALLTIGPFEDWSACRSPSRAKRRWRQGHMQRVRFYHKPDPKVYGMPDGFGGQMLVCHPETAHKIAEAVPKWEHRPDARVRPEHR